MSSATLASPLLSQVFLSTDGKAGCGFFSTSAQSHGLVAIKDYKISYEIHGTGSKKVLLLMGFLSSMAGTVRYLTLGWGPVVHHFLTQESDYQFLVLDNRGVGLSTNGMFSRYTTKGMALDAAHVLKHVGWTDDRSVHLCGISMGGMIALELASMIPTRFKSLGLLVTCAKHKAPAKHAGKSERAILMPPGKGVDGRIKGLISIGFSDEEWLDAPADEGWSDFATNRERIYAQLKFRLDKSKPSGLKTLVGQGLAVRTHNVTPERLAVIKKEIPDIIALAGEEDKMIDPSCTEYLGKQWPLTLAKHLDCPYLVFKGKGHIILLEAEKETLTALAGLFKAGEARWSQTEANL
ncbi:hypothetical protein HDV03_000643 [Kappamyces sp. JEL0829]|nr:hypothetical protein HDV03_000643 [Kappamyces sp. JEL0829]